MERLSHYILPEHTNELYRNEAISSISLAKDVAEKINEIIDALNERVDTSLAKEHEQDGRINKAILYMKDNLINSLRDLLASYNSEVVKGYVMEAYGAELANMKVFVTPQMYGAAGNGSKNDIYAIENAIAALEPGGVLYFPKGTYLMQGHEVVINKENITFAGEGLILCDYGFRPKASNFRAVGLRMEGLAYSQECRAFWINNPATTGAPIEYIENFSFKDCHFKNFFYSVAAVGGAYNHDGTEEMVGYPVRDVVIENCYSTTYTDQNAGHFQCIQVENIAYINNRTYGGKNASSYNAIKANGYIRVIGNYDHNNSYASCEIENGSGRAVIANNTFNYKIWVDDSFSAVVNANTAEGGIYVTVGTNVGDAENIVISNNVCKNIRCEQFGTYNGGVIRNVNIVNNVVNGDNTHGIWIHGNAVQTARICGNFITGTNTNDIAIQRNDQLDCYTQGNFGNGQLMLIAGSGGQVYALDVYNMTVSGNRDSLPASHLEREYNGLKVVNTAGNAYRLVVDENGDFYTVAY